MSLRRYLVIEYKQALDRRIVNLGPRQWAGYVLAGEENHGGGLRNHDRMNRVPSGQRYLVESLLEQVSKEEAHAANP